jgi:hypothetical protein
MTTMLDQEVGGRPEWEWEAGARPEWEWEDVLEARVDQELETDDELLRTLRRLARQPAGHGSMARLGSLAGRRVLAAGNGAGGRSAGAAEAEWELEEELPPATQAEVRALMDHIGHVAAEADSDAEAEAFLPALAPLAAKLVPLAAPHIIRAAPQLIRGITGLGRMLRRRRATRPLVQAIPEVVRQATVAMAREAAAGQPLPPPAAVRTLAGQAALVLGDPRRSAAAYRRARAVDRRFHRQRPCGCGH